MTLYAAVAKTLYTNMKQLFQVVGINTFDYITGMEFIGGNTLEFLCFKSNVEEFKQEVKEKMPELRWKDGFDLREPAPSCLEGVSAIAAKKMWWEVDGGETGKGGDMVWQWQ